MTDTKNCPYCGEEIRLKAKKCKHCKEMLDAEDFQHLAPTIENQHKEIVNAENTKGKTPPEAAELTGIKAFFFYISTSIFILITTLWIPIVLIVIATFTVPSENSHIRSIEKEVVELTQEQTSNFVQLLLGGNNGSAELVDFAFSTDAVNTGIINKFNASNTLEYKKSWLWSTTKIINKTPNSGMTISYGFFGFVFTDFDFKDFILQQEDNTQTKQTKPQSNSKTTPVLPNKKEPVVQNRQEALKYNDLGTKAYQAKDYPTAIDYYLKAISNNKELAQAYGNLGLAYQKQGQLDLAIETSLEGLYYTKKNTEVASINYNLGKFYEQKKDYPQALRRYELAQMNQSNPTYQKAIERIHQFLENIYGN